MTTTNNQTPAAFFDLDDTIIIGTNSMMLYIKYLVKRKEMPRWALAKGVVYSALHKLNLLNIEKLLDNFIAPYKGRDNQEVWDMSLEWFKSLAQPLLAQEALKRIRWHQKQGHTTILLSSASQYVCLPVKDYMGLNHSINSIVEVKDGILTGQFLKPLCYQEGKVYHTKKFVQQHNIDLTQSYFYTDSITDLPMLEKVGNPIVINPDPLLKREALKRNWPIEHWITKMMENREELSTQ